MCFSPAVAVQALYLGALVLNFQRDLDGYEGCGNFLKTDRSAGRKRGQMVGSKTEK